MSKVVGAKNPKTPNMAGSCKIQPTSTQNTMAAQRIMAVRAWPEIREPCLSSALATAAWRRTSGEMYLRTRENPALSARALLTKTGMVGARGDGSPCSFEE